MPSTSLILSLTSINVGQPEELKIDGKKITTAFRKRRLGALFAQIDANGLIKDRKVHGDPRKAIHAMLLQDVIWWAKRLGLDPETDEIFGVLMGENFTLDPKGLSEKPALHIGDTFICNGMEFTISTSRQPRGTFTLLHAHTGLNVAEIMRENTDRAGFYLEVRKSGRIQTTGALLLRTQTDPEQDTIAEDLAKELNK